MLRLALIFQMLMAPVFQLEAKSGTIPLHVEHRYLVTGRVLSTMLSHKSPHDFVKFLKPYLKIEDATYLETLTSGLKNWPQFDYTKDTIVIRSGKARIGLRIVDLQKKKFNLNGREFIYESKKSLQPQFQEFSKKLKATASLTPIPWYLSLFESQGFANPAGMVGPNVISQGNPAGTALMATGMAVNSALAGSVLAGGMSATAAVGVLAATVLAFVAGAHMMVCGSEGALKEKGERWDGFMNCLASPLDFVGANPRRHFFVTSISCPVDGANQKIEVVLQNKLGETEKRTFRYSSQGELLNMIASAQDKPYFSVEFVKGLEVVKSYSDLSKTPAVTTVRNDTNGKEFAKMNDLAKDLYYYQDLCKDPVRKNNLEKQAAITDGAYSHDIVPQGTNSAE